MIRLVMADDEIVILKGLGEFEGIRKIFLEHIEETME